MFFLIDENDDRVVIAKVSSVYFHNYKAQLDKLKCVFANPTTLGRVWKSAWSFVWKRLCFP